LVIGMVRSSFCTSGTGWEVPARRKDRAILRRLAADRNSCSRNSRNLKAGRSTQTLSRMGFWRRTTRYLAVGIPEIPLRDAGETQREPDATDHEMAIAAIVPPNGSKELPHRRRSGGGPGKGLDAQAFKRQAKKARMLIEGGGLISDARKRWADENRRDTASAVCVIVL